MRLNRIENQDGKALMGIVWGVGIILIIIVVGVLLTVTGAYKYPPTAINYPVIGQFIAKYGTFRELSTEGTEGEQQKDIINSTSEMTSDQTAVLLRDITLKGQQIDDLKGQLETKNDTIAKLEEDLQSLRTQLDTYKQKNLKALINVYDRMETRAATEILSQMNPERAAIILGSIKDRKAAEILAAMDTQTALAITQIMGGFDRGGYTGPWTSPRMPAPPPPATGLQTPTPATTPGSIVNPQASSQNQPGIVGPMPPPEEQSKEEQTKKEKEEKVKEEKESEEKKTEEENTES